MRLLLILLGGLLPGVLSAQSRPLIDYHQHLLSPSAAKLASIPAPFTGRDLVGRLDAAGIRRAVVLSLAYQYGNPNRPPVKEEYARVKEENDWTARQVAEFPCRLRAFCGVDPLKEYALVEIARCAKDPYLHYGPEKAPFTSRIAVNCLTNLSFRPEEQTTFLRQVKGGMNSDIRGDHRNLSAEAYFPESSRYLSFGPLSRKERELPRISCTQPWTHPRVRLSLRKGA